MSLTTLGRMQSAPDSTESLVTRTKKLLRERGEVSLREVADGAGVGHEWLRSFFYRGRIQDPGVTRLEKLHNYLAEYHAARRFRERGEPRMNP